MSVFVLYIYVNTFIKEATRDLSKQVATVTEALKAKENIMTDLENDKRNLTQKLETFQRDQTKIKYETLTIKQQRHVIYKFFDLIGHFQRQFFKYLLVSFP